MKAMYINAPGKVEIQDVEKPVRKKGEVLLKDKGGYDTVSLAYLFNIDSIPNVTPIGVFSTFPHIYANLA